MDTPNKITVEDVRKAFAKTEEAGPHRGLLPEHVKLVKTPETFHNAPDDLKEQFKMTEEKTDNIYEEGKPDLRYDPTQVKPSRFRKRYRKLRPEEIVLHDEIKRAASHLEFLIEKTKPSRERSLGITKLEESIMWTIKGLTG